MVSVLGVTVKGTGAGIGDEVALIGTGLTEKSDGVTDEVCRLGWLRSQYCPNQ